jgi:DNA-directed RNA polymerase specialized sigma24 family protein
MKMIILRDITKKEKDIYIRVLKFKLSYREAASILNTSHQTISNRLSTVAREMIATGELVFKSDLVENSLTEKKILNK